jgi:nicotinamidase-related amidase
LLKQELQGAALGSRRQRRKGEGTLLSYVTGMPEKNEDLHGSAPESCRIAVLLVDVINDMEFEGGEALLERALPMARKLARFAARAREAGVPVIYVNDNFGKWRSDFRALLEHCTRDGVRGREVAKLLAPNESDYFVLKPKHSAFFSTTLDTLLEYLDTDTLIITGLTTDICVLFTASDAYMRDLHVLVPEDCCASASEDSHRIALELMRRNLDIGRSTSDEIDFSELAS